MSLHPATQILIWCALATAMQFLTLPALLVTGILVFLTAFLFTTRKLFQLVRRTRWIMFSLWLVYAYSTPGQALFDASFSPSREGMMDGGLQMMRLLAGLAGLSILLDRLHRQQLITGLYSLLAPLQWLGLSRERLAVRLALTLHYAEVGMMRAMSWQDSLRSLTSEDSKQMTENRTMELPVYRFGLQDALLLLGAVLLLWQALR